MRAAPRIRLRQTFHAWGRRMRCARTPSWPPQSPGFRTKSPRAGNSCSPYPPRPGNRPGICDTSGPPPGSRCACRPSAPRHGSTAQDRSGWLSGVRQRRCSARAGYAPRTRRPCRNARRNLSCPRAQGWEIRLACTPLLPRPAAAEPSGGMDPGLRMPRRFRLHQRSVPCRDKDRRGSCR